MTDKRQHNSTQGLPPLPGLEPRFQHPSVCDLAWLLFAPNLFNTRLREFAPFTWQVDRIRVIDWLSKVDDRLAQDPQAYPAILRSHHRRLGVYCESLAAFCFTEGWKFGAIDYELIVRNYPFRFKGLTLGECDFILRSRSDEIVHLELAVKFYLQHQDHVQDWSNWIGPNSEDRLDKKMKRMLDHQLPLLRHEHVRNSLAQILPAQREATMPTADDDTAADQILARHLIKGCVFTHISIPDYALPMQANSAALCGRWCFYSEFMEYAKKHIFADGKVSIEVSVCEKLAWLSGAGNADYLTSAEEAWQAIQKKIATAEKASVTATTSHCMMAISDRSSPLNSDLPNPCKLLLVPGYWPNTSSPSRKR